MSIVYLITGFVITSILTLLIFAPFEPIDDEIADALDYENQQEKMRKALGL